MPPDDDIETLLKAYARNRRQAVGDSLNLHPVNRRQLHEEVRRVYDSHDAPANPWWAILLRPRFAFGVALCALLAMAVVSALRPDRADRDLAFQQSSPTKDIYGERRQIPPSESSVTTTTSEMVLQKRVEPSPRQADASSAPDRMSLAEVKEALPPERDAFQPGNQPTSASAPAQSGSPRTPSTVPVDAPVTPVQPPAAPTLSRSGAPPTPGPDPQSLLPPKPVEMRLQTEPAVRLRAAVPAAESLAAPATVPARGLEIVGRWRFASAAAPIDEVSAARRNRQSSFAIMNRFEIEATRQGLLIRDDDGSVYQGTWMAGEEGAPEEGALDYAFRAGGTNLTTGRPIEFEGRLAWLPQSGGPASVESAARRAPRPGAAPTTLEMRTDEASLGDWWIQGALKVGREEEEEEERAVRARHQSR